MKPAPFDYVRAESLAEAHDVLAAEGSDAALIAGGQTLVPLLSMRMARPKVVVDIMRLSELAGIAVGDDMIRVGAVVRQAVMHDDAVVIRQPPQPWLRVALRWINRNRTDLDRAKAKPGKA